MTLALVWEGGSHINNSFNWTSGTIVAREIWIKNSIELLVEFLEPGTCCRREDVSRVELYCQRVKGGYCGHFRGWFRFRGLWHV